MKVLSIEQKASAYDDVRERIAVRFGSKVAEEIFSEYEDSDDERIRKALINGFKDYKGWDEEWFDGITVREAIDWLERLDLVDKGEPKFKPGDWVVNKFGDVWHIDSFDKKNYQVSNGNEYNYFPISEQNEMHLWTIQDAKDGDVLVDEDDRPFIFKGFLDSRNPQFPVAYCGIDDGDSFFACRYNDWWTNKNCFPTTKEQRDLLFQKMHEAGYEWDVDEKELKKIIDGKQIKKNLQDNSFRRMFEQTSSWSEDDEKRVSSVLLSVKYCKEQYPNLREYQYDITWLKNLKGKIQPQNYWKPSDDQIKTLEIALRCGIQLGTLEEVVLKQLLEQLKELK